MTSRRICRRFADAIVIVAWLSTAAAAQNVPIELLQQPGRDSWYHEAAARVSALCARTHADGSAGGLRAPASGAT